MLEMSTRIRVTIGALLILVVILGVVVQARATDVLETHHTQAFYPVYESLGEIVNDSMLVVRGTADKMQPSRRVIPDGLPLDKLPLHKATSIGFLVTDMTVKVEHVMVGAADLAGSTIVVTHMGGTEGKRRDVAENEPLSRTGEEYLLFLRQMDNGRYAIVGGPQGRYPIRNGKLTVLTTEAGALPLNQQLLGIEVMTFEKDFNRLMTLQPAKRQVVEVDEPLVGGDELPSLDDKPIGPDGNK
jgi:hypothetical protein